MNKIALYTAALAVAGLASCSQDRDPVLQKPTEFVLNVPAMQQQYIDLTEGDALELVASQPNYGFSAVAQYGAQMSLTEDFAAYYDLEPKVTTVARMEIPQVQVALGIMELAGVTDEASFAQVYPDGIGYQKVYFRATCRLAGVEGTEITSNVVSYDNIKAYFAVPVPGYIYLVGAPEGWAGPNEGNAEHYADWKLYEPKDAIGSHVYSGVFDIPAGQAMFRFYTQLTGWDADSYGYQVDDKATDFPDFTSGTFTSPVVKGKGSFNFPNWPGGKMTVTVDMSDMNNITMTCTEGETSVTVTKYIYVFGSVTAWNSPDMGNEDFFKTSRLADTTGDGIYTGEFPVSAGHCNFRFALTLSEDNGWDNPDQIGAAENDGDVPCNFVNGNYSGSYMPGKGNWAFELANDGTLSMTVDTNNKTVAFDFH